MTQFRLSKPHYLRHNKAEPGTEVLVEAGSVIEWEGPPSLGMEAVDEEGAAKCKERDEKRDRSKAGLRQVGCHRSWRIISGQSPSRPPTMTTMTTMTTTNRTSAAQPGVPSGSKRTP